MDWLPPIFIMCNPLHEPERYSFLQRHLSKRGIPLSKVEFVHDKWGSELVPDDVFGVWQPFGLHLGIDRVINFKATALMRGEISLNRTFYKVVQKGLQTGADYILVFESDIVLREDFLSRFKEVVDTQPDIWDYISLGEGVNTRPPGREMTTYFGPTEICDPPKHPWVFRCCDSMLLHRKFLEKLAVTFLPFREALDWELNLQLLVHKGKAYWVDPPLAEPGTGRHRTKTSLPS